MYKAFERLPNLRYTQDTTADIISPLITHFSTRRTGMAKTLTPNKKAPARKSAAKSKGNGRAAKTAAKAPAFKLTYSTMYNPPDLMHTRYDKALAAVKANLGQ